MSISKVVTQLVYSGKEAFIWPEGPSWAGGATPFEKNSWKNEIFFSKSYIILVMKKNSREGIYNAVENREETRKKEEEKYDETNNGATIKTIPEILK